MRFLAAGVAALTVLALSVGKAPAAGSTALASAYSTHDSNGSMGCTGRPLRDDRLTFASLIVPCGAKVRFCIRRRCVVATRTDSGPYSSGRSFDLTLGVTHALGVPGSAYAWGVRAVSWERV